MGFFEDLKEKKTEDILEGMHRGEFSKTADVPFHVAESLIEVRIMEQLYERIKTTGETLFKASMALKESTDQSILILKTSIDDFRKSNETASKALTRATYVLAFVALIQAVVLVYPLLKGGSLNG